MCWRLNSSLLYIKHLYRKKIETKSYYPILMLNYTKNQLDTKINNYTVPEDLQHSRLHVSALNLQQYLQCQLLFLFHLEYVKKQTNYKLNIKQFQLL